MSKLISGKEALIALANDEDVDYFDENLNEWVCMDMAHHFKRKFRLKPKTITINGVGVPAPFEPKEGDDYFIVSSLNEVGYLLETHDGRRPHINAIQFGAWKTEEEIKQVVKVLRSIFNVQ